jgi:hypothetical protein
MNCIPAFAVPFYSQQQYCISFYLFLIISKDAEGDKIGKNPDIQGTEKLGVFDVNYLPPSSDEPYQVNAFTFF